MTRAKRRAEGQARGGSQSRHRQSRQNRYKDPPLFPASRFSRKSPSVRPPRTRQPHPVCCREGAPEGALSCP